MKEDNINYIQENPIGKIRPKLTVENKDFQLIEAIRELVDQIKKMRFENGNICNY